MELPLGDVRLDPSIVPIRLRTYIERMLRAKSDNPTTGLLLNGRSISCSIINNEAVYHKVNSCYMIKGIRSLPMIRPEFEVETISQEMRNEVSTSVMMLRQQSRENFSPDCPTSAVATLKSHVITSDNERAAFSNSVNDVEIQELIKEVTPHPLEDSGFARVEQTSICRLTFHISILLQGTMIYDPLVSSLLFLWTLFFFMKVVVRPISRYKRESLIYPTC